MSTFIYHPLPPSSAKIKTIFSAHLTALNNLDTLWLSTLYWMRSTFVVECEVGKQFSFYFSVCFTLPTNCNHFHFSILNSIIQRNCFFSFYTNRLFFKVFPILISFFLLLLSFCDSFKYYIYLCWNCNKKLNETRKEQIVLKPIWLDH